MSDYAKNKYNQKDPPKIVFIGHCFVQGMFGYSGLMVDEKNNTVTDFSEAVLNNLRVNYQTNCLFVANGATIDVTGLLVKDYTDKNYNHIKPNVKERKNYEKDSEDIVVFLVGANDIFAFTEGNEAGLKEFQESLDDIFKKFSDNNSKVYVVGMPEIKGLCTIDNQKINPECWQKLNQTLSEYSKKYNLNYFEPNISQNNIANDNLHLTPDGYKILLKQILKEIDKKEQISNHPLFKKVVSKDNRTGLLDLNIKALEGIALGDENSPPNKGLNINDKGNFIS